MLENSQKDVKKWWFTVWFAITFMEAVFAELLTALSAEKLKFPKFIIFGT